MQYVITIILLNKSMSKHAKIELTMLRTYVKRVSQRSAKVVGFLRVLRFPPTGKVDRVG
jgi:hypothetical protein